MCSGRTPARIAPIIYSCPKKDKSKIRQKSADSGKMPAAHGLSAPAPDMVRMAPDTCIPALQGAAGHRMAGWTGAPLSGRPYSPQKWVHDRLFSVGIDKKQGQIRWKNWTLCTEHDTIQAELQQTLDSAGSTVDLLPCGKGNPRVPRARPFPPVAVPTVETPSGKAGNPAAGSKKSRIPARMTGRQQVCSCLQAAWKAGRPGALKMRRCVLEVPVLE